MSASSPNASSADSRPNILLLFSDEHSFRCMGHRPDDEGGEPVDTPALDALAAQGTVFSRAYCQMPLCTPSRLCLLTGREVRGAGAWNNGSVLRPELPTMASVLRDAGYETCLVGKMHLGGNVQFAGYNHRPYGDLTGKAGHQDEPAQPGVPEHRMRQRTANAGVTAYRESQLQEQITATESIAFLREHQAANPGQPWFLTASFSRPHFPLNAPARWMDRYWPTGVTEPQAPAAGDAYDHPMSVGMRKGFMADDIDHHEMLYARAAYFACVSYLDEIIDDLLARLQASGLLENTIIIYTTDHGEMAGEHGVWWKNSWHEASAHIPMIISTPQQRRGEAPAQICDGPAELIDLLPTFAALAGVEAPDGVDGVDLSPVITSRVQPEHYKLPAPQAWAQAVAQTQGRSDVNGDGDGDGQPAIDANGRMLLDDRPVVSDVLIPRWGEGTEYRMVCWRRWKYIRFRDAPPLMFDLQADPLEQHNLLQRGFADEAGEFAAELLARFCALSMDFDEAQRERTERDGALEQMYPLDPGEGVGNLYMMPDGRVVADDVSIQPARVITDDPAGYYADWSGRLMGRPRSKADSTTGEQASKSRSGEAGR